MIRDEVRLHGWNDSRIFGDLFRSIDKKSLVTLRGGLDLTNRLVECLTQFGLGIACHALEFSIKTSRLTKHTWQLLRAEDYQPEDQQKDDFAAREVEHADILRPVLVERYARAMQQSLPRLFARPILFAHRGANLVHPENTLPAFVEALRLGATGLETDVWVTRDGVVIIDHDGTVRSGLRRRQIKHVDSIDLPSHLPTFESLLRQTPVFIDISVDVKDSGAFGLLVPLVEDVSRNAESIWVCHPEIDELVRWREESPRFSFVHSTKLRIIEESPEKHARLLRDNGVRVCNMHWRDWSGGLAALYHRFEVACFAWGLNHETEIKEMLRIGIDGLFADDVDLLVRAAS